MHGKCLLKHIIEVKIGGTTEWDDCRPVNISDVITFVFLSAPVSLTVTAVKVCWLDRFMVVSPVTTLCSVQFAINKWK